VTARLVRADLAAEPLAGGLPGDPQGGGGPVPASPGRPGERDALGEQCFITPRALGGLGDRPRAG
jgi:hypothetical protein